LDYHTIKSTSDGSLFVYVGGTAAAIKVYHSTKAKTLK